MSAGKPGRFVAAFRPPVLMAIMISGKITGGITSAGCRIVWTIARRAIS